LERELIREHVGHAGSDGENRQADMEDCDPVRPGAATFHRGAYLRSFVAGLVICPAMACPGRQTCRFGFLQRFSRRLSITPTKGYDAKGQP
jgi:hypothetical protein